MSRKSSEKPTQPHDIDQNVEDAYAQMAQDEEREEKALEWSEALISDVSEDEAE